MRIGLDLHGVFLDSKEMKRKAVEYKTPLCIPSISFRGKTSVESGTWYQFKDVRGGRAVEPREWDEAMKYLHETDAHAVYAEPIPGAVEAVRRLSDLGHEIGFVTSTKGLDEGKVWAIVQKFKLPISFVHATKKKPKTQYYEACDAAIDDDPVHLKPLDAVHCRIITILLLPRYEPERNTWKSVPPDLPAHIQIARGWDQAMPHLLPLAA